MIRPVADRWVLLNGWRPERDDRVKKEAFSQTLNMACVFCSNGQTRRHAHQEYHCKQYGNECRREIEQLEGILFERFQVAYAKVRGKHALKEVILHVGQNTTRMHDDSFSLCRLEMMVGHYGVK